MHWCKIVLIIAGLLAALAARAAPLEFAWDKVTLNTDGSPAGTLQYKVYKKPQIGAWSHVFTTSVNRYTWLVPSLGRYTFRVTAINEAGLESDPSNEVKVFVDRVGKEEK